MSYSKYRAVKTVIDGITFASKKEARRYSELKLLERAKQISGLTLQPRYVFIVEGKKICAYVGDFLYMENDRLVCEDCKGFRTTEYRLKRKLFMALNKAIEHRET